MQESPADLTLRPPPCPIDQTVCLPGSKSLTIRALLAAALAQGRTEIQYLLLAQDTRRMIDALAALGVAVQVDARRRTAHVQGAGGHWPAGEAILDAGDAGTVARLMTAACCVSTGDYTVDGSSRMRERPMAGLVYALRDLGAQIGCAAREGHLPLTIAARGLRGGVTTLVESPSSQFVSALLMSAPLAREDVLIEVRGVLPSRPYVDMTLRTMRSFGVDAVADGLKFIVPAPQTYRATQYVVEPDASAASYFFGAAAITGGRVTVEGLGLDSAQGDLAIVDVLERMGCRVEQGARHTTVWGPPEGRLRGVDADLGDMPDVAQTLGVLAVFADAPTRIRSVGHLRIKETNRLFALSQELGSLGAETEVFDDGLLIRPASSPRAAAINTYGDHRMAMSFALAGLRLDGVVIREPGCVGKSFPEFFEVWAELGR